jgi:hypothetical protein
MGFRGKTPDREVRRERCGRFEYWEMRMYKWKEEKRKGEGVR